MTPKSCAHMHTTSLGGISAKWPARAPKMKLIPGPRDPQGYSRISFSLSGRILKEYQNIVSAEQNYQDSQYRTVSKPFSSPQTIMYRSAIKKNQKKKITLPLDQTWMIRDRTSLKLNFISEWRFALCKLQCNKPNTNLLSVNASRILFTRCVGTSVILKALLFLRCYCESLLHIFIYHSFCFRCSAVCFGTFCTEGNAVGFKFYFDMRHSINFAKSHSVEVLATQMDVMWHSIRLKVSLSEMHKFDPFSPHSWSIPQELCIVIFWVACELLQFAATQ